MSENAACVCVARKQVIRMVGPGDDIKMGREYESQLNVYGSRNASYKTDTIIAGRHRVWAYYGKI